MPIGDFSDYDRHKVTVEVDQFTAEYAGCGSHHLELVLDTDRISLAPLYEQLKTIFE